MKPYQFVVAASLLCAGLVTTPAGADDAAVLTPFSTATPGEPPAAWRFATLPNKKPTRFAVVDQDGARVLKVEADSSYGNLVHGVHIQATDRAALSWKWRVDTLVQDADLKTRAGDDSPAKVCVFFAFDTSRLSFTERTKLAVAHSVSGEEVPGETLCYVWDNKLAVGTDLVNAFTKRIRMVVIETGGDRLSRWLPERRDVGADYRRLFGDESDRMPEIVGVAVSADADNTYGHSLAYFGDIEIAP